MKDYFTNYYCLYLGEANFCTEISDFNFSYVKGRIVPNLSENGKMEVQNIKSARLYALDLLYQTS